MPLSPPPDAADRLDAVNIRLKPDHDTIEVFGVRFWGDFLRAFKALTASGGHADIDLRVSVAGHSVIRAIESKRPANFPDELPNEKQGRIALAMLGEVRIFQFGEHEWIAAESLEDAIKCLDDHTGSADEYEADDVCELTLAEMIGLTYADSLEDESTRYRCSFLEALALRLAKGEQVPFFFATSEF